MRNFGEAYKSAAEELPKFHMDAVQVRDELHHRKMTAARRRKTGMSVAAAACVFLICGVGAASAMNYRASVIEIEHNGFSFTNDKNVYRESSKTDVQERSSEMGLAAEGYSLDGNLSAAAAQAEIDKESSEEEVLVLDAQVMEPVEYSSIDEFRSQEDIAIAIPELSWLGNVDTVERQDVMVLQDMNTVIVSVSFQQGVCFSMNQTDNRESLGYASGSAFMGEAVNERTYANSQGLVYKVFDSEEDGKITSTHAAISVNGRDLTLNFFGFEQETVGQVLDQLDLSIYFTK